MIVVVYFIESYKWTGEFLTSCKTVKNRHCEERSNLNAHASSDRCKIASSAEKAFSQ